MYRKNFLSNVILRLDFNNVDLLNAALASQDLKFSKDIYERYPVESSQNTNSFSISQDNAPQKISQIRQRQFQNEREGNKIITLMSNALVIEYKQSQYKDFNSFFNDVQFIFLKFQNNYSISEFTRLGLRYINEIEIPGIDPLCWEGYLNTELAQAVKAGLIKTMRVARSMHQLHLIKEDVITIFNYGLYNKNYPNPVLFPAMVLDYDCYIPIILPKEDVLTSIEKLNNIAQELFENSIGDSLKNLMEFVS